MMPRQDLPHRLPPACAPAMVACDDNGTNEGAMNLFKTVRPNIVQSIRAFRVPELAQAAAALNQHFLYANCAIAPARPRSSSALPPNSPSRSISARISMHCPIA
jgi:hypothetical protein